MSILMSNISLFARGSLHQGHEQFSDEPQGRQCAFMSLSALLCEQLLPIQQWSSERINQILLEGDRLFLNALRSRQICDKEAFCSSKLPIFACWSSETIKG